MPPDPVYLGYRAASALAQIVPGPTIEAVSTGLGRIGSMLMADRRAMVERHQRRVDPDATDAVIAQRVRGAFASYARYWVESFRLPGTARSDLERQWRTEGYEHVEAGLAAGQGVVLALPHLGGWEWAAFWLTAVQGRPVTAVAEVVEPPELAEWFIGLRRQFGLDVVALGPDAGPRVARALKANQIVCLLCDRDVAGGGVDVEFFGERTTLPGGPATLAARSGAPLLPTATYFDGKHHLGVVRPPVDTSRQGKLRTDVARITQDLAHELEGLIRRAPDQWHLMQPNWPSDRV
ncbi:MAG: phosphatidylinositol mannoside acyltransferase [Acidimicrobiales bacterium]